MRRRFVFVCVSACIAATAFGCGGGDAKDSPDTAGVDVGDGAPGGDASTDAMTDAPGFDAGSRFPRVTTRRIAAASNATCVVTAVGNVQCWVVGDAPVLTTALTGSVKTIAMGSEPPTVCGLFADGSVKCTDLRTGKPSALTSQIPARAFTNVTAGRSSFTPAALLFDGGTKVTRVNDSNARSLTLPLTKSIATGAIADGRVCAVDEGGALACIDQNLVYPDWTAPSTESYRDVATDGRSVCGVTTSGTLRCWDDKAAPLAGLAKDVASYNVIQLASAGRGESDQICALIDDGRPACAENFTAPTQSTTLPVGEHVVEMAVGNQHRCGIRPDDTVVCWNCPTASCNNVPAGLKAIRR